MEKVEESVSFPLNYLKLRQNRPMSRLAIKVQQLLCLDIYVTFYKYIHKHSNIVLYTISTRSWRRMS